MGRVWGRYWVWYMGREWVRAKDRVRGWDWVRCMGRDWVRE